jgi:hypothetical protein
MEAWIDRQLDKCKDRHVYVPIDGGAGPTRFHKMVTDIGLQCALNPNPNARTFKTFRTTIRVAYILRVRFWDLWELCCIAKN